MRVPLFTAVLMLLLSFSNQTQASSLWNDISWMWTKGHYSLQTEDGYPTVSFYCLYLNNNLDALDDDGTLQSNYYDTHLMKGPKAPIIRSLNPDKTLYHYTPRPGFENQTIDYVEGWYAQQNFLEFKKLWKNSPQVSDIQSYVEAQIKIQSAKQGRSISKEELYEAKETCDTLREKLSNFTLTDLRKNPDFGVKTPSRASETFDYIDQLITRFLKCPYQEMKMTLVEEYVTDKRWAIDSVLIKGNPIMTLSYDQNINSNIVTLAKGVLPEDHLPFTILQSTDLPYEPHEDTVPVW